LPETGKFTTLQSTDFRCKILLQLYKPDQIYFILFQKAL
jgi:hypothetical protein